MMSQWTFWKMNGEGKRNSFQSLPVDIFLQFIALHIKIKRSKQPFSTRNKGGFFSYAPPY